MVQFNTFSEMWERLEQDPAFHAGVVKMAFTDQLAELMSAQGLRNSDLAERMGCSRAYITKVFSGTTNFTLETMVSLARVLEHRLDIQLRPVDSQGAPGPATKTADVEPAGDAVEAPGVCRDEAVETPR
jgi:transcriptional regulator with XRE-family HTH domain